VASQAFTIAPRSIEVIVTSTLPGASGAAGTITITHNAAYGALVGKTVALEPTTGFSFDSPMLARPR